MSAHDITQRINKILLFLKHLGTITAVRSMGIAFTESGIIQGESSDSPRTDHYLASECRATACLDVCV
jgi:hypothetical protein